MDPLLHDALVAAAAAAASWAAVRIELRLLWTFLRDVKGDHGKRIERLEGRALGK